MRHEREGIVVESDRGDVDELTVILQFPVVNAGPVADERLRLPYAYRQFAVASHRALQRVVVVTCVEPVVSRLHVVRNKVARTHP